MSKGAYILSFRVLQELGSSLGRFSSKVLESLEVIQSEIKCRLDILENRHSYYEERLQYLQRLYDDADEDDDRAAIAREIESAEEDLREIRYWMRQVEESLRHYMRNARTIHEIATSRTCKANSFLQRKLEELHSYINTQADGSTVVPNDFSSLTAEDPSRSATTAGNVHINNFNEFGKEFQAGNIQFMGVSEEYVNEADILSPEQTDKEWDQRQSNFWNHHGNTHEIYRNLAEKYRTIQQELAQGKSLDDLKLDEDMRPAVEFWWSNTEPVKLSKYKGTYWVDAGFHRVTLAKNYHLGAIPAKVTETALKRPA